MKSFERFEAEIAVKIALARYAIRLKACGIDLYVMLRRHAGCAFRALLISALQSEFQSANGRPAPRRLVDDIVDEWLEPTR